MSNIIVALIIIIGILIINFSTLRPYLITKNKMEDMRIINEKNILLANIDITSINEKLDKYFEDYIERYIVYKFIANKVVYINQDEVDEMVKDLTKRIVMDMSELYIFYLQLNTPINSDDDIISAVFTRVQELAVEKVSTFNSDVEQ